MWCYVMAKVVVEKFHSQFQKDQTVDLLVMFNDQCCFMSLPTGSHTCTGSVWDCGELAAELFWQKFDFRSTKTRVLEIGSGTGIGGIAAAMAGAEVMISMRTTKLTFLVAGVAYGPPGSTSVDS